MKTYLAIFLCMALLMCLAPVAAAQGAEYEIRLSGQAATLDGVEIPEYDYTWHADPTADHDQVKNSPAEYYTGTAPTGSDPVYIAHDIIYSPELPMESFRQVTYAGDPEWVYMYQAPGYEGYIFSTLPAQSTGFPSHMMHTPQEAYQNPVLHITQPGTYRLTGSWQGQIWVDVGKKEDAKVTLILDGVDIRCTVAPALVFYKVYECKTADGDAGANLVLAEGSQNQISGANVFRILKTKHKDGGGLYAEQKKAWKLDAAIYSYQTLHIRGQGALQLQSSHEGLASERHIAIFEGNITIQSQDDGINANEKDISTIAIHGGSLDICAGLGAEGDGMDSNGTLEIRGGNVVTAGNPGCDVGLDSRNGTYIHGGTVLSMGEIMTAQDSGELMPTAQSVVKLDFSQPQTAGEELLLKNAREAVLSYTPDGIHSRSYPQMILSAPGLKVGERYTLEIGGVEQAQGGSCTAKEFLPQSSVDGFSGIGDVRHDYRFDGHSTYTCALCGHQYSQPKPTQTTPVDTAPTQPLVTQPATTPQPTRAPDPQEPEKQASHAESIALVAVLALAILGGIILVARRQKDCEA